MDEKKIELIVRKVIENLSADLEPIKSNLKKKKVLGLGFTEKEKSLLEEREFYQFEFAEKVPVPCNFQEIWIGNLDIEDIFALSMGLETSYGRILSLLVKGKNVKIFSLSFVSSNENSYLQNRIKEKIEILEEMGFVFETKGEEQLETKKQVETSKEVERAIVFSDETIEFSDNPVRFRIEKKLVAEKDVMNLPETVNVLEVATTTIFTPSAKDMLKEKQIMVVHLF